ncbi:MAG: DNA polymerase III subunit [Planctomycetaceae bacterium]|nr:DNA polymerase III subunit [Planctomycetaceae bacterium]
MWQGILGHDDVVEQFRRRLAAGRVNGTFLFVGPAGVGKRLFAQKLAQTLLCQAGSRRELDPCGHCEDCTLMAAGTHPDFLTVAKPADKSEIPLSLLIGPPENRMREGLCHEIGMKPFRGGRRIAVIDDADELNEEGANALLKTLEEPPPKSVLILIGTSADRQLPTIRSRSQMIRFAPLAAADIETLLVAQGLVDAPKAAAVAGAAEGSLERARRLADPELSALRTELYGQLAAGALNSQGLAKLLLGFAEGAGKDAGARRERLRWSIGFLVEFYRELLRVLSGAPLSADRPLADAAAKAGRPTTFDAEAVAAAVERALEAIEHVDRNAHYAALVEALCDDLARTLTPVAV